MTRKYRGQSEIKIKVIEELNRLAIDHNDKDFLFKLCSLSAYAYEIAKEKGIY